MYMALFHPYNVAGFSKHYFYYYAIFCLLLTIKIFWPLVLIIAYQSILCLNQVANISCYLYFYFITNLLVIMKLFLYLIVGSKSCWISETATAVKREWRTFEKVRGRSKRRTTKKDKNFREETCWCHFKDYRLPLKI